MKKGLRKAILAAVLAASISVTSVAPAFAAGMPVIETESAAAAGAKLKNGWNMVDGKRYYVEKGEIKTGWRDYRGYKYYLDKKDGGAAVTGLKTISKKQYYFDSKARLVVSKFGYKIGSKYYSISAKGVLKQLSTVEGLAGIQLDKLKGETYEAFKWVSNFKYKDTKLPAGKNAADYYGQYGLKTRTGDCNVQAYTFYWLAKRRGYDIKYVKGYVPQAVDKNGNPTKFGAHAWCELNVNGKIYVCDPSLAQTEYVKKGKDPKPAYKFQYGAKGTYRYYDTKKRPITKK